LPTKEDLLQLAKIAKKHKEVWELEKTFSLSEPSCLSAANLNFNIEVAFHTGESINLSNDQNKVLATAKESASADLKILNEDLSIKTVRQSLRKEIGYFTRGDYSQARGHGVGFAVILDTISVASLKTIANQVPGLPKKGNGLLALFRNPTSLMYHFCWIFRAVP